MAQTQETPQIFEGELIKVDATAKTLPVRNSAGQEMEFRYSDQTLISGADGGVEGLAAKSGTPVVVHFDTATRTGGQDRSQTTLLPELNQDGGSALQRWPTCCSGIHSFGCPVGQKALILRFPPRF